MISYRELEYSSVGSLEPCANGRNYSFSDRVSDLLTGQLPRWTCQSALAWQCRAMVTLIANRIRTRTYLD